MPIALSALCLCQQEAVFAGSNTFFFWGGVYSERKIHCGICGIFGLGGISLPNVTLSVFLSKCLPPLFHNRHLEPQPWVSLPTAKEGYVFTSVCPLGEGVGYLWSQVPSRCLVPCPFGGTLGIQG